MINVNINTVDGKSANCDLDVDLARLVDQLGANPIGYLVVHDRETSKRLAIQKSAIASIEEMS